MAADAERCDCTRVQLIAGGGLVAVLTSDGWPVVGELVEVRAGSRGPWPGTIQSFHPAQRVRIDWTLRLGEPRSTVRYAQGDNTIAVGDEHKKCLPSHSWLGGVTECDPATEVTISYEFQNGATRRTSFCTDVAVPGFFELQPDGSAAAYFRKPGSIAAEVS